MTKEEAREIIKLQADGINGIALVDYFDEYFDELTGTNILLACLETPGMGNIYAEVTAKDLAAIRAAGYTYTDERKSK